MPESVYHPVRTVRMSAGPEQCSGLHWNWLPDWSVGAVGRKWWKKLVVGWTAYALGNRSISRQPRLRERMLRWCAFTQGRLLSTWLALLVMEMLRRLRVAAKAKATRSASNTTEVPSFIYYCGVSVTSLDESAIRLISLASF